MSLVLRNLEVALTGFVLKADRELSAPVTGLTGPSGAGKTSLLEAIAGLRRLRSGEIELGGVSLHSRGRSLPPERRRIGYVPQDLALFPHLDTGGNLRYGFRSGGPPDLFTRVVEVMELQPLLRQRIDLLSGGERQRVALGRALLAGPRLLLLDEPLSGLDERLKSRILPFLHRIRREFQVPMIYVTHSRTELNELCDEVLTLEQGRLIP